MTRTEFFNGLADAVKRHRRLLMLILFLAIVLAVVEFSGLREHFHLQFVREQILRHPVGGLMLFVLLFSLGNLIHIPGLLFLAAAVISLGKLWGGAATYFAAMVSCVVTFATIRAIGGDALRLLDNRLATKALKQIDAHPIAAVAALRMLFQTAPSLNYVLAVSGVKFRPYLIGTALGLPIPIAIYCIFFEFLSGALHLR